VLRIKEIHTDREVTENKSDIMIKTKKKRRQKTHSNGCGNTCGYNCRAKGNEKEAKIPGFVFQRYSECGTGSL